MSDDKLEKSNSKNEKSGSGFLSGCVFGLLLGIFLGWWFRPPPSFPIDELKKATEEKFLDAKEYSREELADLVEDLAKKLREVEKKEE
jgi:hypothetical protein